MKKLYWFIGITLFLGVVVFFLVFGQMIFISQISQFKLKMMSDFQIVSPSIKLKEIPNTLDVLETKYRPSGNQVVSQGKELLLKEDGTIEEGKRVYDGDKRKSILTLDNHELKYKMIFLKGQIFELQDQEMKHMIHEFKEPAYADFRYVSIIDKNQFLMVANLKENNGVDTRLIQVEKETFKTYEIASDPYYSFSRAPLIISLGESLGTAVIYYTGDIHFAFGGDSSRPHWSTIRIYNNENPKGIDLIKMSLAAGTIVNLEVNKNGLLITTDPSLPSMANTPKVEPRTWQLSF
ncbi:MAG: hypothetical protein ACJAS4_002079 [Bacteriovoracaceae bacterium]